MQSKIIQSLINSETKRQNEGFELIASENYVSQDVRAALGSILTNKYAEGYPKARYYGGCEYIDQIEAYAIARACRLFGCKYANVQPHSGSQANFAAYHALMPKGGKVLSLVLNDGGHLTHGSPVSFSGHDYKFVHYPLGPDGHLDYDVIRRMAQLEKPDVILAGFSAYPYIIDFQTLHTICMDCGAKLMVDMAHIAGLVATGRHPSPFPFADVVTSTTQKTLRGPRGGLILWNDPDLTKKINSAVFPYAQGGPLENTIAAKAVCFEEASTPDFYEYIIEVLNNTKAMRDVFYEHNATVTDTETHLFLLETFYTYGLTGKEAQDLLEEAHITVNKNMMPGDTLKPNECSGVRIGTAALTTRGLKPRDAMTLAETMHHILCKDITPIEGYMRLEPLLNKLQKIEDIK